MPPGVDSENAFSWPMVSPSAVGEIAASYLTTPRDVPVGLEHLSHLTTAGRERAREPDSKRGAMPEYFYAKNATWGQVAPLRLGYMLVPVTPSRQLF
jgi:hypothetical protein